MPAESAVTGQALARGEPPGLRAARGRPLTDAVAAYRRSPSALGLHDLLRPFVAACHEVAYAHSRGTAHLALTPRHILLGEFGETAVVGWDRVRPAPSPNGQPAPPDAYAAAFLAPEQAAGATQEVGPASDVYALGAILYAILTGQPPYTGSTVGEVLARAREGLSWQPRMVAKRVPVALESVCLTAMERDPVQRYATASELAREVERWMAGERVRTNYVEPRTVRMTRWLRSPYGVLTLIGLLVASLVSLAVAVNVIHVERGYMEAEAHRLAEGIKAADQRAQAHVAEVHRQRAAASDQFAIATQTLGLLAARAEPRPGEDGAVLGLKADLLRTTRGAARLLAQHADQSHGADLPAAHDRVKLAELFRALREDDEARRQYERAVIITRQITGATPADARAQQELVSAAYGLSQVCLQEGQASLARNLAAEAHAAAEAWGKVEPNNPLARREAAVSLDLMARACIALHELPAAREAFDRMISTVEGYANPDPRNLLGRLDLANSFIGRGRVERLDHRFEEALAWYDRAAAILRPLKAEGKLQPFPHEVARLEELEKSAEECRDVLRTVEDVNFALTQRGGETTRRLLVGRSQALARRGRAADAAATAERLRALKPDDGVNLYDVACCYALCVPAVGVGKAADALTPEEKAARDGYAARALSDLRAAADHGFRKVEVIESDPDFDSLHAQPLYRALVAELKALRVWVTFPVLP